MPEEIAFKNFKKIHDLETFEERQKAWLKDYHRLNYGIALFEKHQFKWKTQPREYKFFKFDPKINLIKRKPNRTRIEFDDEDVKKIPGHIKAVKEKLKEMKVGWIESTHNGKSNYLWVEFERDMKDDEIRKFLGWIAPANSKIDLNFASSNKLFQVMYAIHWRHSKERELPIQYVKGSKIDYDSLGIEDLEVKTTKKQKGDFEYETFIKEEKESPKIKNPFNKLHYSTDHLPMFHEFSSLIGLYGRHYLPILKARWYQLHGGILQKEISLGGLHTDSRVHCAYPLPTESGKNEIIYSIKKLINIGILKPGSPKEKFTMSEPLSYSPESLIGKKVERKIDNPAWLSGAVKYLKSIAKFVENRGHFDNDFLEFDECSRLITSENPECQQAREYLSKGENPIGRNKVEKRLVDDLPNEAVSYFPYCTDSYYFQPFGKIPENAILQGFMRRKIIPVGNVDSFLIHANNDLFRDKLAEKDFSEEIYSESIIKHLQEIRDLNSKQFTFTEEAKKKIQEYSLYLSEQGRCHSEKISNYCRLIKYTSLANLIKFAAIIGAAYGKTLICENCVSLAFMDLIELNQNTFNFIFQKVRGNFDYGQKWHGANAKQIECLKVLHETESYSKETSKVKISHFIKIIEGIYKIKEDQARNRYFEMKKKDKLIDSCQVGQNNSAVWLLKKPKDDQEYDKESKGYKVFNCYNNIFTHKEEILNNLGVVQTLQPLQS